MKVLFLTNVPSPYRVAFFNELGKLCDLTVLFERTSSKERDESWKNYKFNNFNGVFLKGVNIGTDLSFGFGAIKYIKKHQFDFIVCANIGSPTVILTIRYLKKHSVPYFIETDGGKAGTVNGFKGKLKRYLESTAVGCFSPSVEGDNSFITFGGKRDCIYRYPFTSLYEKDIFSSVSDKNEKVDLRRKLGITEDKVIISVGRFSYLNGYGKGYDVLLRSAKTLPKDIGWYIVGGEPTEEFKKLTEENGLNNVHYVDFKQKEELKEYYRASDLFVLMTVGEAWGLVVNEAMSTGLPVITTDKCVAGLELVKDDENGYIVKVGDDKTLSNKIQSIIYSDDKLNLMGQNSLGKIRNYTIENMARIHLDVFKKLNK